MSLGSDLREAREAAGLSVTEVADRTRIRRTLIECIERDDFAPCGGDVYARGHIRALASVVGLDPAPLLAEFERAHGAQEVTATEVLQTEARVARAPRERTGANWTAVMVAALLVIAVIGGFELLHRNGGNPTAGSTPPSSPHSSSSPASPSTSSSSSAGSSAIAQATAQGVQVQLTVATGKSWVAASNDAGNLFEGLVNAGQVKTFTDSQKIKLVIGNAGAVRLVVNGVDLGSPGGSGQVVRLTFGPGNPTAAG
jgi:cytoskeleton protein RodZ